MTDVKFQKRGWGRSVANVLLCPWEMFLGFVQVLHWDPKLLRGQRP